jgi:NADH:ubiquinone oxidoreductase subunit E
MKTQQPERTDTREEVMRQSRGALPEEVVAYIDEVMLKPRPESYLISVLHRVQGHLSYLGEKQLHAVAQLMQIPAAKVTGVASFYHFFRLEPRGRFVISVCLGTACYVKGAEAIVERLREELGIDWGQTTTDGMFTLEVARCLGTCGLAPVVMVNDEIHGKVTPDQIPSLLQGYFDRIRGEQTHRG